MTKYTVNFKIADVIIRMQSRFGLEQFTESEEKAQMPERFNNFFYNGSGKPDILIKVEKNHFAEIIPPTPIEIKPYELKSIPVTVRNLGSHVDTFNFRVNTDAEGMIVSIIRTILTERYGDCFPSRKDILTVNLCVRQ